MNILKELTHATEFIISESGGSLSREAVVVSAGEALPAGQLLILDESNRTYSVLIEREGNERDNRVFD